MNSLPFQMLGSAVGNLEAARRGKGIHGQPRDLPLWEGCLLLRSITLIRSRVFALASIHFTTLFRSDDQCVDHLRTPVFKQIPLTLHSSLRSLPLEESDRFQEAGAGLVLRLRVIVLNHAPTPAGENPIPG
jgi:hypothetical protein